MCEINFNQPVLFWTACTPVGARQRAIVITCTAVEVCFGSLPMSMWMSIEDVMPLSTQGEVLAMRLPFYELFLVQKS
jgi:hypothetical protein